MTEKGFAAPSAGSFLVQWNLYINDMLLYNEIVGCAVKQHISSLGTAEVYGFVPERKVKK